MSGGMITVTIQLHGIEYEVTGDYDPADPSEPTYGPGGKPPAFYPAHINFPCAEYESFLIDVHGDEIANLCLDKIDEMRRNER